MPDNVKKCKERLRDILKTAEFDNILNKNIVCANFFDWDFKKWQLKKDVKIKKMLKKSKNSIFYKIAKSKLIINT